MTIRWAEPGDAAAILGIYAPYVETTPISLELTPPDAAEMARRMDGEGGLYPWIVAEEDGAVVSFAYASRFRVRLAYRFCAETSIYVARDARGRGLGRALYGALFDIMRRQGFTEAMASITLPNAASVAVHEAFGFRPMALYPRIGWKFDRWWDVGFWQATLTSAVGEPPKELIPAREMDLPS